MLQNFFTRIKRQELWRIMFKFKDTAYLRHFCGVSLFVWSNRFISMTILYYVRPCRRVNTAVTDDKRLCSLFCCRSLKKAKEDATEINFTVQRQRENASSSSPTRSSDTVYFQNSYRGVFSPSCLRFLFFCIFKV